MASQIRDLLARSLHPGAQRQAEQELKSYESNPRFSQTLLEIVSTTDLDISVRLAAALFFKNHIKRHWNDDSTSICLEDRTSIKQNIVAFMTAMSPVLQLQVGEAVTLIADSDFPDKWESLIDDLIKELSLTDMQKTNAVLLTAHSIFKRWRPQFRTDALFQEIGFVLGKFCRPFLELFIHVDRLVQTCQNAQELDLYLNTLLLLTKVFYDLNCQDIPEFFEDNMASFMEILHRYLTFDTPLIASHEDEAGPMEKIKASVCEIVELYAQRYEDVFPQLPQFVNTIWTLLTSLSLATKNDMLVAKSLSFLTSVIKIQQHASLFKDDNTLKEIIERIALPNMTMRETDEELFEDDPIEFIRRDLEGSDSDTRRRSATDFIRGLTETFEGQLTPIVLQYVQHYLQQYQSNTTENWRQKDTAVYLTSAIATKGHVTRMGVMSTNMAVDIVSFFNSNILPDLAASNIHPVLRVDAIKFAHIFRNQLTKEQIGKVLPTLANCLTSDNYVVFTYAAVTLDSILTLKQSSAVKPALDNMLFSKAEVAPLSNQLLSNLFSLIEANSATPEKLAENDFLMRAIMRLIIASQDLIAPSTQMIVEHLVNIIRVISRNPSNPKFNHYCFESIGAVIKYVGSISQEAISGLESLLIPPLLQLLQDDVTEFIPYVFQLLAQALELHDSRADLPNSYKQLLKPILTPALWDSRGNIPALVRLLQAFLLQASSHITADGNSGIEPILGIFQKLIASRFNYTYGFDLIESVYACIPSVVLSSYNHQIFVLLLTRLNTAGSEKINLNSRFISFALKITNMDEYGPGFICTVIEGIQAGIFTQLYSGIILSNVQKISNYEDSRVVSVGLTNFLTKPSNNIILEDTSSTLWTQTLTTALQFLELPVVEPPSDEGLLSMDIEETMSFQAAFAKLHTATKPHSTKISGAEQDPKKYLADMLNTLPSTYQDAIRAGIPEEGQKILKGYGVRLQ